MSPNWDKKMFFINFNPFLLQVWLELPKKIIALYWCFALLWAWLFVWKYLWLSAYLLWPAKTNWEKLWARQWWSHSNITINQDTMESLKVICIQINKFFSVLFPLKNFQLKFWNVHFRSLLGPFLVCFWFIFGPFLVYFRSIYGPFSVYFRSMLRLL